MIVRLLYEPQLLQTLCGITKAPHVGQVARFGAVIFQFALLLSLWLLEDLFLGQIDMINTSFFQRITRSLLYGGIRVLSTSFSLQNGPFLFFFYPFFMNNKKKGMAALSHLFSSISV